MSDLRGILLVVAVESFILMPSTDFTHTALSHSRVKFLSAAYFTFVIHITAGFELDLSQDQTVFAGCAGAVRVNVMHMMHRAASAREGEKSPKDSSPSPFLLLLSTVCACVRVKTMAPLFIHSIHLSPWRLRWQNLRRLLCKDLK